jgi:CheY-like chemotaxis protein
VISVSDTGVGMTDEVARRAFEPFFTTKEPGRGSGLGLSQVYGFVQQSGGFVSLTSRVGSGTELLIYLPPSSKPVTRLSSREQVDVSPAARSEVVLLVEDDPDVLALVTQVLAELGYRVVTACDANGALRILRSDEAIDLLLTDIVMPGGKSGVQLATEARALRPGIKVMLTTGYSGEALARHWSETPAFPILCKPFRAAELAARLREILSAS